jgi:hypothetical protein
VTDAEQEFLALVERLRVENEKLELVIAELRATRKAKARRNTRAVEVIIQGDMYGWDEYIRRRIIDGIRQAVNSREEPRL